MVVVVVVVVVVVSWWWCHGGGVVVVVKATPAHRSSRSRCTASSSCRSQALSPSAFCKAGKKSWHVWGLQPCVTTSNHQHLQAVCSCLESRFRLGQALAQLCGILLG